MMTTPNTYKITYKTDSGEVDIIRVTATTAREARGRLMAAAESTGLRIDILRAQNEDAAFERLVRSYERTRAGV